MERNNKQEKNSPQSKMSLLADISHFTGSFTPTVSGHELSKPESAINLKQLEHNVRVDPENDPTSTLFQTTNKVNVDFIIPSDGGIDYIDSMILEYNLQNTSLSTAINLVDAFCLIDELIILIGNTEISKYRGVLLRHLFLLSHSDEKLATTLPNVGIDGTTYAANLTIPANTTITVRVPLFTLLTDAEVPIWMKYPEWKMRFNFKTGSDILTAGSAAVTNLSLVTATMKLLLQGQEVSATTRTQHTNELLRGEKTFRYIEHYQTPIGNNGTIVANSPIEVNYPTSGYHCAYFLQVQPKTAGTGHGIYGSDLITSFELQKDKQVVGHSFGNDRYYTSYNKLIASRYWTNVKPLISPSFNMYQFCFSQNPQFDIYHGANSGAYRALGSPGTILRIVTPNNVVDGNVIVWSLIHSYFVVDYSNQRFNVFRMLFN